MPANADSHRPHTTAPLAVWLAVQLAAIAVVVTRVPLWAAYPDAPERLAAYWVFGVQVIAGGMLFPFLLRDFPTAIQILLAAIPFQVAAQALSGERMDALWAPAAIVAGWLLGLACWAGCLRSMRAQAIGIAVVNCLIIGAAALHYLRLEFSIEPSHRAFETASPLLTTFAAIGGRPPLSGVLVLSGFIAGGAIALLIRKRRALTPAVQNASENHIARAAR